MVRRRPLLRTAVVGGGAYMAGKGAARRAQQDQDQEARLSDLEAQQAQQSAPAAAPAQVPGPRAAQASAGSPDVLGQLSQLVQMHDSGALTDEEFAAAKAQLLG